DDDVGGFHGDVRAALANRDAYTRLRHGLRVVNAVTRHRDNSEVLLQIAHPNDLVIWQEVAVRDVDPGRARSGRGRLGVITSENRRITGPSATQACYSRRHAGTNLIRKYEEPQHSLLCSQEGDRMTSRLPFDDARIFAREPLLYQEARVADPIRPAIDHCL